ncbi:hypothetical protein GOBAR_AA20424 [Gossypium barbadense]|uniref:3'(2'),5'-bisphosphate nucleotidase n=1 Tax=Gossypium barbadense TaxID=3634 RepID=A0A2P5XA97_GOSBA|nr:hypothetical protein GOBAR_AA20424 [Gossypium barbadense]
MFSKSRNVQKALLQSDVQSETDKTPLTVADYGSQAVVSFVLQQELHAEFSLVAKEDSKDLRKDGAQEIIKRITKLVNDSLTSDGSYNITLSTEDVLKAIDSSISEGGCQGRYWVLDPIDGTKGGDRAIYLRFPYKGYREKIWDHAARCIVVTEAGGVVIDAAWQPLDFSKGKHLDMGHRHHCH